MFQNEVLLRPQQSLGLVFLAAHMEGRMGMAQSLKVNIPDVIGRK